LHGRHSDNICLHELFELQADKHPKKPALISGSKTISYATLENRANALANIIKENGAGPGKFVALYFNRGEKSIIAILAVLKAGAAYIPIDPAFPIERIRYIFDNAKVSLLCTEQARAETAREFFQGTVVLADDFDNDGAARITLSESGVTPDDLCYVIYTSGTTGRPKGVMARHRNVAFFSASFNEVCNLTPEDRVYQGFSLGFDGSVEEIWMAFTSGATLVVGEGESAPIGSEAAKLLNEQKVTYFSTVPTFLSMISEDLPTVRTLVVSGEQCPSELVDKWARPGRTMLNVYGPTETTVNTTAARCAPGKKVTIGKPIRGYDIQILSESMQPVSAGEIGELFIGGGGVSRGYLNNPETTAKSFIPNPLGNGKAAEIVYRTGDLVRLNEEGELLFLGRMDSQVKIRGYRIELAEIESVLLEHPAIQSAVVKVHKRDGLSELAAYVTPKIKGALVPIEGVIETLRKRLPVYMVPSYLDVLGELPTLSSGKINRGALPEPKNPLRTSTGAMELPTTPTERIIVSQWEKVFQTSPISITDDFFTDLGGYSLLAAQMISTVRAECGCEISLREIYTYSTPKKLAAHIDAKQNASVKTLKPKAISKNNSKIAAQAAIESVPGAVRKTCHILQAVSLYCIYGLGAIPFLAVLWLYFEFSKGSIPISVFIGIIVGMALAAYPALLSLSIVVKWLIIGRYKPGHYPVGGWYYFRWWLVTRMQIFSGSGLLSGTPLMARYFRLMGAKIGRNCTIASPQSYIFDCLRIGSNSSINAESQLLGYRVENGLLKIGTIAIGNDCFVGISSAVGLNTIMENGSALDDLSLLPDNQTIPRGAAWRGAPGKPVKVNIPQPKKPYARHPIIAGALHACALYCLELFMFIASIPTLVVAILAYKVDNIFLWLALIACAIPLYEAAFCLLLVIVKWTVLGKAKPGIYPVHSLYYVRMWYIDTLLMLSRFIVLPVYTTLYYLPWIRMLGAKVGARAEFSVVSQIIPDLTEIGPESFLADGSIIGGLKIHNGAFLCGRTAIGRRTFVGNSAVLPVGSAMGSSCLLGVLSTPPDAFQETPNGTEWLGSPSFSLPHRKKVEGFSETTTFRPTKKMYAHRLAIDAMRICIPSLLEIFSIIAILGILGTAYKHLSPIALAFLAPLVMAGLAIGLVAAVAGVKNLIMGQFTPIIKPLWSPYVWLNEVVNGAYEAIAAPIISMFFGTALAAPLLRLFGCKIGKHCFIETALFGEFDLVTIGDYVSLNNNTIIQNHLFEDRIFKASTLTIGNGCSTGNMSVVLYDSEMREGSAIGPLSLLMKGETLPEHTQWTGIPVEQD